MPNLTVSIPHQLGRAEAKRRIQEEIGKARAQYGNLVGEVREDWNGDRLDFALRASGQSISGFLVVEELAVNVDVALPWLLHLIASTVKEKVEQRGRLLLGGPKTS